jgi:hypothetical protein
VLDGVRCVLLRMLEPVNGGFCLFSVRGAGDAGGGMLCAVLHAEGCGWSALLREVLEVLKVLVREGCASSGC